MKFDCPLCITQKCKDATIKNGKCLNFTPDNIGVKQHRFFRGIVLPALAEALGETNNNYVHELILKPEWIYRQTGEYYYKVDSYNDIPSKYQDRCRLIGDGKTVKGYIPSMANFTKKETKDYLKFCDALLYEIGGNIPIDLNDEYRTLVKEVL